MWKHLKQGLSWLRGAVVTVVILGGAGFALWTMLTSPAPSDVAAQQRAERWTAELPTREEMDEAPRALGRYCLGGVEYRRYAAHRSYSYIPHYEDGQLKGCDEEELVPNLSLRCIDGTVYYKFPFSHLGPMLRPDATVVACPNQ
jgi:hypothetical protein